MSSQPTPPIDQPQPAPPKEPPVGIAHWAEIAVQRREEARGQLEEKAVHDLRVAVRRCRSIAEGMAELDPDPDWGALRKQGKKLFGGLGALRDAQVMQIWLARLAPEDDPVRAALEILLDRREAAEKKRASKAVKRFDSKKWLKTAKRLDRRADRLPLGGPAFQHQALQRWEEAHELHRLAMRDRTKRSYHRLRIGLKRFRYSVENFLPELYAKWRKELKGLQDQLGDIHDLDVLWDLLPQSGEAFSEDAAKLWRGRIETERRKRLAAYRLMMVGSASRWPVWRRDLPTGEGLEEAAVAALAARASFLDRDFEGAKTVEALSARLYDLFSGALKGTPFEEQHWKHVLRGAAWLDDATEDDSKKAAKKIAKAILDLGPPLGWSREDLEAAAEITRCRRTAEAPKLQKRLAKAPLPRRKAILILSGLLRLAGFLHRHKVEPGDLRIAEPRDHAVVVRLRAKSDPDRLMLEVGAWKNLLEWAARRAVLVELEAV